MMVRRKRILVHEFDLPFDDNPMNWAGGPISEWNKTPKGQWVIANTKPSYYVSPGFMRRRVYKVRITADLDEKQQTYYYLRWPK